MKQLKVLTFCTWTSIGSILQSFGLKKALAENGCESTILLPADENKFHTTKVRSLKSLLSRAHQVATYRKRRSAYRKRCAFITRELDVTAYEGYSELEQMAQDDAQTCYLAGSDQIWHPDRCDKHFFLEFVRGGKCISYAASMGKTEIPPENLDNFRKLMQRLDRISVREAQCKEALQPLTDKPIDVHIDPTFLLDTQVWRRYEQEYPIRGPYILLYMIYWDPACKAQIRELKQRTGLPVYAVCSALSRVYADKRLFDVGVEEFLWLIDHAEYVITSSFHGAALSTIFNKKFAVVINPATPSRIRNLLQTLGIPEVPIRELDGPERFEYTAIQKQIAQERSKGLLYLKEAINQ